MRIEENEIMLDKCEAVIFRNFRESDELFKALKEYLEERFPTIFVCLKENVDIKDKDDNIINSNVLYYIGLDNGPWDQPRYITLAEGFIAGFKVNG